MNPVRTEFSNANFKLVGGTEENDLPVERTVDLEGNPVIVSMWKLTDEERLNIMYGADVRLVVWGTGHPPVALAVGQDEERVEVDNEADD